MYSRCLLCFFFFNDTATTEIYTLSLHDALPIYHVADAFDQGTPPGQAERDVGTQRSEEHTSELQSHEHLVCRLLLEKKTQSSRRRVDADLTRRLGGVSHSGTT